MMLSPASILRASARQFSARAPKPETKVHRFVAMSCMVSGVVVPFIPPALESSREKKLGNPHVSEYVLNVLLNYPHCCFSQTM